MFKKLAKTAIKKIGSGNKQKFSATMASSAKTKAGKRITLPKDLAGKKFTASTREGLNKKISKAMKDLDRRAFTAGDGSIAYRRKKTLGEKAKDTIRKPEYAYLTGVGAGSALGYQTGKTQKNKKKPRPKIIMASRKKRPNKS
tara:strand:+ start:352 stop:780 length:429 start_codon:yes stop_codon:yes gene_type:complete